MHGAAQQGKAVHRAQDLPAQDGGALTRLVSTPKIRHRALRALIALDELILEHWLERLPHD